MDNFKAVYKILSELEKQMDDVEVDTAKFDYEALNISENRWHKYMEMMYDCGYIKGIYINQLSDGMMFCNCDEIKITLKGLEYLQENHIMRKMYRVAKGLKDITPGA